MVEVTKETGFSDWPLENCCVCRAPTHYWYGTGPLNVALCPTCATKVKPSEIPTKEEWIKKERSLTPRPIWQTPVQR